MRSRSRLLAVAVLLVAGACDVSRPEVLPPPPDTGPPPVYVSVGASETTGAGSDQPLRDGWPRVLHRTALAPGAIHVNMGIPGATVAQAHRRGGADARWTPGPTWSRCGSTSTTSSPASARPTYETPARLPRPPGPAQRHHPGAGGQHAAPRPAARLPARPLLADLPSPEELKALVAQYNAAIARVVQRQGAFLVDLHAVGMAARAAGTEASFISRDGFHPSTAGHARVAEAFAEVLKASGPLTVTG